MKSHQVNYSYNASRLPKDSEDSQASPNPSPIPTSTIETPSAKIGQPSSASTSGTGGEIKSVSDDDSLSTGVITGNTYEIGSNTCMKTRMFKQTDFHLHYITNDIIM